MGHPGLSAKLRDETRL